MSADELNKFVLQRVGQNVGRIRDGLKISQAELARRVGVNRSHLNQFEGGKQNISLDLLVKLADGLDVPITDFFEGLNGGAPQVLFREARKRP